LFMSDFVTLCIGHLENVVSLSYTDFPKVDTFPNTVSNYYHTQSYQKRLQILESCQAHSGRYEFSKILIFT
jgi:hypothetical protein